MKKFYVAALVAICGLALMGQEAQAGCRQGLGSRLAERRQGNGCACNPCQCTNCSCGNRVFAPVIATCNGARAVVGGVLSVFTVPTQGCNGQTCPPPAAKK